jgi:hypothetical protein
VSIGDRQESGPIEEANTRLAEGLKSCRAVIRNYRSLLMVELDGDAAARRAVGLDHHDSGQASSMSSGGS